MTAKNPEVIVCKDIEDLSMKAADLFARIAQKAVSQRGVFTVALSGGNTPLLLYKRLAGEPYRKSIDWKCVHIFWGDERCVPPSHADSNYRLAYTAFISKINMPVANVHRIKGEACPQAADEYEKEIKAFFTLSAGEFPAFDLTLLGMGADSHTASIFPQSPVVNEKERIAVSVRAPADSGWRVTLTPPAINASANVIFLTAGRDKAEALKECVEGGFTPEKHPAQITRLSKGRVLWLADIAAASMLKLK